MKGSSKRLVRYYMCSKTLSTNVDVKLSDLHITIQKQHDVDEPTTYREEPKHRK